MNFSKHCAPGGIRTHAYKDLESSALAAELRRRFYDGGHQIEKLVFEPLFHHTFVPFVAEVFSLDHCVDLLEYSHFACPSTNEEDWGGGGGGGCGLVVLVKSTLTNNGSIDVSVGNGRGDGGHGAALTLTFTVA